MVERKRGFGPDDTTGSLEDFKAAMDADDNVFWRMECGHHLNLLEDALDRLDTATRTLRRQPSHADTYLSLAKKFETDFPDTVFRGREVADLLRRLAAATSERSLADVIGAVWDDRCGPYRSDICETCRAFHDLCDAFEIEPPPTNLEDSD